MDYTELKTAVTNMLGTRSDLTTEVPDFIAYAEADFNAGIRCREMETRATTTAEEYLELPSDYLELRDVQINVSGKRKTLEMLAPSELDRRYGDGVSAEPKAYAIIANQIQLAPVPDSDYEVEIVYYAQIPALSDVTTTNWLLTKYQSLYLYQSLFYALTRVQDAQLAMQWGSLARGMMDNLNGAERRQRWSGPPMSIRAA